MQRRLHSDEPPRMTAVFQTEMGDSGERGPSLGIDLGEDQAVPAEILTSEAAQMNH
jgi:hypothetical protein